MVPDEVKLMQQIFNVFAHSSVTIDQMILNHRNILYTFIYTATFSVEMFY